MNWTVLATFVSIAVTAILGFLAIAREGSLTRKLERVSAVLSDIPATSAATDHLTWLRDDLARRVNLRYRAPRELLALSVGWTFSVLGSLLLLSSWVLLILSAVAESGKVTKAESAAIAEARGTFWIMLAIGFVSLLIGQVTIVIREARRNRWAAAARADETASPLI